MIRPDLPLYVVILVEPEFEESVGFVARVMKNFGLRHLLLVNPEADIGSLARMKAVHAQEVLDNAEVFPTLASALERVDLAVGTTAQKAHTTHRILRRPATPREFAEKTSRVHGIIGLVLGREGTGLTNDELDLCDTVVTIPTSPAYPTMNISHAATVIFYELLVNSQTGNAELLADSSAKRACLRFFEQSSRSAGLSGRETGLAARALRNIMGRSAVRARETSSLAGAFRKIAGRLAELSDGCEGS